MENLNTIPPWISCQGTGRSCTCQQSRESAFVPHQGLFEFRVMLFGVMNAPAVLQLLMQRALSGLQFVSFYLDDVIVYPETLADHVNHLRIVLECLRTADLKLW